MWRQGEEDGVKGALRSCPPAYVISLAQIYSYKIKKKKNGKEEMNEDQIMRGQYMVFTFYTEKNEKLLKDIELQSDMIRLVFLKRDSKKAS